MPLMAFDRKTQLGTLQSGIMVSDLPNYLFHYTLSLTKEQIHVYVPQNEDQNFHLGFS